MIEEPAGRIVFDRLKPRNSQKPSENEDQRAAEKREENNLGSRPALAGGRLAEGRYERPDCQE